ERDVRALLATIMKGWPAGNLLVIRGRPEWLNVRSFESGPALVSDIQLTILDGQQRLTSLFHALCGVGPEVYALDLTAYRVEQEVDAIEDSIRVFSREEW